MTSKETKKKKKKKRAKRERESNVTIFDFVAVGKRQKKGRGQRRAATVKKSGSDNTTGGRLKRKTKPRSHSAKLRKEARRFDLAKRMREHPVAVKRMRQMERRKEIAARRQKQRERKRRRRKAQKLHSQTESHVLVDLKLANETQSRCLLSKSLLRLTEGIASVNDLETVEVSSGQLQPKTVSDTIRSVETAVEINGANYLNETLPIETAQLWLKNTVSLRSEDNVMEENALTQTLRAPIGEDETETETEAKLDIIKLTELKCAQIEGEKGFQQLESKSAMESAKCQMQMPKHSASVNVSSSARRVPLGPMRKDREVIMKRTATGGVEWTYGKQRSILERRTRKKKRKSPMKKRSEKAAANADVATVLEWIVAKTAGERVPSLRRFRYDRTDLAAVWSTAQPFEADSPKIQQLFEGIRSNTLGNARQRYKRKILTLSDTGTGKKKNVLLRKLKKKQPESYKARFDFLKLHSGSAREIVRNTRCLSHCDHLQSDELNQKVGFLLTKLHQLEESSLSLGRGKRMICGMKETVNVLRTKPSAICGVLMCYDLDARSLDAGLGRRLREVQAYCMALNAPIVYALRRKELNNLLSAHRGFSSCVALLNISPLESIWFEILELKRCLTEQLEMLRCDWVPVFECVSPLTRVEPIYEMRKRIAKEKAAAIAAQKREEEKRRIDEEQKAAEKQREEAAKSKAKCVSKLSAATAAFDPNAYYRNQNLHPFQMPHTFPY